MSAIDPNSPTTTADYLGALRLIRDQLDKMLRLGRGPAHPPIDEVPSTVLESLEGAIAQLDDAIGEVDEDPDIGIVENLGAQRFVDMPQGRPIE